MLRGPAAALRGVPRRVCARGCTSSRATARSSRCRRCETGRPLWVDDPTFNLEYHVRQTALPAPGTEEQLLRLAARIFSQQLDRSKPLWEMWLVEGLEDDRFALISKTHHALIDGISRRRPGDGDVRPHARARREVPTPPTSRGSPQPEPTRAELVAGGVARRAPAQRSASRRGAARRRCAARSGAGAGPRGGRGPRRDRLGGPEPGAGDAAERRDRPAPALRRRAQRARGLQAVKNAFGGTVNDVVLTVVSRRAARLAALARRAHRGPRAARARPGLDRAPSDEHGAARQPHRRDARPAAGLHRGPDRAAARRSGRRWTA